MEYCLYYGQPAIVELNDDGRRMIRLALNRVSVPERQVFAKYQRLKHSTRLTISEFFQAYGHVYDVTLVDYDRAVELGAASELPAGYWHKHIHASWWTHRPVVTGFPPAVRA